MNPVMLPLGRSPRRSLLVLLLCSGVLVALTAQGKPSKEERKLIKADSVADDSGGKPKNQSRDDAAESRDRKGGGTDPQARMLTKLREQMEITDDSEWAIIMARIARVDELRRVASTGPSGRGGPTSGKRSGGNAERDALRAAVSDNLPEAEIKSRLTRARELYQRNQEQLAAAQADLRAVLGVRQEAVAVLAGLLPP